MALALAHKNVGLCLFRMGQLAEGLKALEEALPLYEADEATLDVGMVYHDLGLGCELMGDLPAATKHYNSALIRWEKLKNPGPWANTLNGLGVVYHYLGEYEKAAQALEGALEKTQRAGDLRVEAYVWASLGDLHRDLGAYEQSWQCYSQAAEVAERSRAAFILTYALNGQGNLCRLEGERGQAERLLEEALSLAREHDSAYEIALCQTSLGILARDEVDLVESRCYLDQAVQCYKTGGFRRDLAIACLYRANVAFELGDVEAAREDLGLAFQLAQDLGYDQFLVVEGHRLGNLERRSQELDLENRIPADLSERVRTHAALLASRAEPKFKPEDGRRLQILALGQPAVQRGGESVQWTTSRSRELFFCLFQHRQGLRKEEIGGIFWPEHPPQRLDAIFRSSLYRLRRSLFREAVIFEDGVYRFNREVDYESDIEEFERLLEEAEEAASLEEQSSRLALGLKLYRGTYLEGIYADWCALERQRLRERYLNALEALAGLRASQGRFQRAVEDYQQLVAEDPYREPAHRELMRCFYRLGDRAAAIRQYQACVEILRDDLGLSPEPDTETLYLQIIN
jgi:DNA-binding SARP family transcriptional activator